jgi:hypothetical protein
MIANIDFVENCVNNLSNRLYWFPLEKSSVEGRQCNSLVYYILIVVGTSSTVSNHSCYTEICLSSKERLFKFRYTPQLNFPSLDLESSAQHANADFFSAEPCEETLPDILDLCQ